MALTVLARGDRWMVVDKPSGLAIHRSAMVRDRSTLIGTIRRQLGLDLIDPVHRLDRATSGCLLLSLDPARTSLLHEALRAGSKRYLALVRGMVSPFEPIHYSGALSNEQGSPREAETLFSPIAASEDPRCSLVLAAPLTGRRHQIRRHLRDLSHPVLGDSSHGDTRVNRLWRERYGLDRLALHCLSLDITLPDTGERICVTSPLPSELRWMDTLPFWPGVLRAMPELRSEM